jgi:hypothetical protein
MCELLQLSHHDLAACIPIWHYQVGFLHAPQLKAVTSGAVVYVTTVILLG